METNKNLNMKRISNLIERDLRINLKPYSIGLSAAGGVLLFILIVDSYIRGSVHYESFVGTFSLIFVIGGLVFTSRIFSELHQPEKSYQYLTLPASTLEKLISQWLISAAGFIVISMIGIQLVSIIGGGLSSLFFGIEFQWLDMSQFDLPELWLDYLVIHSIFFLGACTFRNHNFIKTLLALFIVGFVISIIAGGLTYALFSQYDLEDSNMLITLNDTPGIFNNGISAIVDFAYWYLMAPFFIVVSYFKLRERQV